MIVEVDAAFASTNLPQFKAPHWPDLSEAGLLGDGEARGPDRATPTFGTRESDVVATCQLVQDGDVGLASMPLFAVVLWLGPNSSDISTALPEDDGLGGTDGRFNRLLSAKLPKRPPLVACDGGWRVGVPAGKSAPWTDGVAVGPDVCVGVCGIEVIEYKYKLA